MPSESQLPAQLRLLASRQALELSDSRWEYDAQRLVDTIESLVGLAARGKRRRALCWAAGAALLLAVIGGGWWVLNAPARIGGLWKLPNGNQWIVTQQGSAIEIEEIHSQTKQVWKRGRGELKRHRGRFNLKLVFQDGPIFRGRFQVSADGQMLRGEVIDGKAGRREPLALMR